MIDRSHPASSQCSKRSFLSITCLAGALLVLLGPANLAFAETPTTPIIPLSTVALEIKLDLPALSAALNAQLPDPLFSEKKHKLGKEGILAKAEVDLSLKKTDPIELTSAGPVLMGEIGIKGNVKSSSPKALIKVNESAKGVLRASVTPGLRDDLEFGGEFVLKLDVYKKVIQILFIKTEVSDDLEKFAKPLLRDLGKQITTKVRESLALRKRILEALKLVEKPHQIGRKPDLWLHSEVEALYFAPRASRNPKEYTVGLGLLARLQVLPTAVNPRPVRTELPVRIPAPTEGEDGESFLISLPLAIGWDALGKLANQELAGERFPLGKDGTLSVGKVAVTGRHGRVVVQLMDSEIVYSGLSRKGTFQLDGKPTLDLESGVVGLEDVQIGINEGGLGLDGLLQNLLTLFIRDKIRYPFSQDLDRLLEQTEKSMESIRLAEGVVLRLDVAELMPQSIEVEDHQLTLQARASGEGSVEIKSLPMK